MAVQDLAENNDEHSRRIPGLQLQRRGAKQPDPIADESCLLYYREAPHGGWILRSYLARSAQNRFSLPDDEAFLFRPH